MTEPGWGWRWRPPDECRAVDLAVEPGRCGDPAAFVDRGPLVDLLGDELAGELGELARLAGALTVQELLAAPRFVDPWETLAARHADLEVVADVRLPEALLGGAELAVLRWRSCFWLLRDLCPGLDLPVAPNWRAVDLRPVTFGSAVRAPVAWAPTLPALLARLAGERLGKDMDRDTWLAGVATVAFLPFLEPKERRGIELLLGFQEDDSPELEAMQWIDHVLANHARFENVGEEIERLALEIAAAKFDGLDPEDLEQGCADLGASQWKSYELLGMPPERWEDEIVRHLENAVGVTEQHPWVPTQPGPGE